MQWMDEWTERQIGWDRIQKKLRPRSVYGQQCKASRRPYCKGDEFAWQADREDAMRLYASVGRGVLGDPAYSVWTGELSHMPDVRTISALLRQRGVLSLEQVAALKRFAVQTLTIDRELTQSEALFAWWTIDGMAEVVRRLAPRDVATRDFSMSDVNDAGYDQAFHAHQQARMRRMSEERAFLLALANSYGVTTRRDATIVIVLDEEEKVAQAKADQRLRIRMLTSFDAVFDPVWSDEVRSLKRHEEACAERLKQEEMRLLSVISVRLRPLAEAIENVVASVGRFDELYARVEMALSGVWAWSTLGTAIQVVQGRQPDILSWVPVDVVFHARVAVLTGPNMGGKSAAQKTWLLLQACHQMGYPVPAVSYTAPLFAVLRYVGGDAQSLTGGLSSFGAEMVMLKEALEADNGFVCFDEMGRHTNPVEGQAIVASLLEELMARCSGQYVLATHFRLRDRGGAQYLRVAGIRENALADANVGSLTKDEWIDRLDRMIDYRIVEAGDGDVPQQALTIAKWLGVPSSLLEKAHRILDENQNRGDGNGQQTGSGSGQN